MKVAFEKLQEINTLINNGNETKARNEIIKILAYEDRPYSPILNHLIREVGLYPYLTFDKSSSWEDKFVYEIFKVNTGDVNPITLHREQSVILKKLLQGQNVALSAPTSFGKSFIIDALIAIKQPCVVVILVPTIALMDEARRRLTKKFSNKYKIITTSNETIEERTILIFPQERLFSYANLFKELDLFIVDEFYKVSKEFDAERSDILLKAIMKLGKIAKQRYFLSPNITSIKDFKNSAFTKNMEFISELKFNTVITNVFEIYKELDNKKNTKEEKFREIIKQINGRKTLVYAGSYSAINDVCELLNQELLDKNTQLLKDFSLWLEKNYTVDYKLKDFVLKGIGIHNGRLHRFLSQIQTSLFEQENGLTFVVSTSSLIEGVNTSAENVIMWKHRNGPRNLRPLDYKNLIGRSGRMFKHFIGNVYLLESPIDSNAIQLELKFSDNVQGDIDISEYNDYLSTENKRQIKEIQQELVNYIGSAELSTLLKNNSFKSSNWQLLLNLAADMKSNPSGWKYLK